MSHAKANLTLDHMFTGLAKCFPPDAARRLLAAKPDARTQRHIDKLAERHTAGRLTAAEEAEYETCVKFSTFIAILKSKVRQLLKPNPRKGRKS